MSKRIVRIIILLALIVLAVLILTQACVCSQQNRQQDQSDSSVSADQAESGAERAQSAAESAAEDEKSAESTEVSEPVSEIEVSDVSEEPESSEPDEPTSAESEQGTDESDADIPPEDESSNSLESSEPDEREYSESSKEPKQTCSHEYVETERVDATCTAKGYVKYTCELCGKTKKETLAKTGHQWGEWQNPAYAVGDYQVRVCAICGKEQRRNSNTEESNTWTGETYEGIPVLEKEVGDWETLNAKATEKVNKIQRRKIFYHLKRYDSFADQDFVEVVEVWEWKLTDYYGNKESFSDSIRGSFILEDGTSYEKGGKTGWERTVDFTMRYVDISDMIPCDVPVYARIEDERPRDEDYLPFSVTFDGTTIRIYCKFDKPVYEGELDNKEKTFYPIGEITEIDTVRDSNYYKSWTIEEPWKWENYRLNYYIGVVPDGYTIQYNEFTVSEMRSNLRLNGGYERLHAGAK